MLKDQLPMDAIGDILVFAGGIGYLGDNNYSKHPFRDRASENYKQVIIALGNLEFYKFYDIVSMQGVFSERFATTPITTTTMSSPVKATERLLPVSAAESARRSVPSICRSGNC